MPFGKRRKEHKIEKLYVSQNPSSKKGRGKVMSRGRPRTTKDVPCPEKKTRAQAGCLLLKPMPRAQKGALESVVKGGFEVTKKKREKRAQGAISAREGVRNSPQLARRPRKGGGTGDKTRNL